MILRLVHLLALFWMAAGLGATMIPLWRAWREESLPEKTLLLVQARSAQVLWLMPGMIAAAVSGVAWAAADDWNPVTTGWLVALEAVFALDIFLFLPLLAVGLHYELLVLASAAVRALPGAGRANVVLAVVLALVAHVIEVVAFGIGWLVLIRAGAVELSIPSPTLAEAIYFSGSVYTSLGFGDIVPVSSGRFLVVLEAVTGLVLIAWTASFTFYQMRERSVGDEDRQSRK